MRGHIVRGREINDNARPRRPRMSFLDARRTSSRARRPPLPAAELPRSACRSRRLSRANIKKRRRHNSSTSAETVWSSRYGCGLSCRHGGESGETCKQYQCAAKDRESAERPRRLRAAQEKPPGIFRPRNIPARWSGAVTSHVLFSLWGPPSQNFLGSLFLRSSGFPGRPPG